MSWGVYIYTTLWRIFYYFYVRCLFGDI
uniref:Uncharacterized protein n=1 Tax=Anguilla anguilla TaxID=7936 RepID=A0A0E9UDB5_ANGAN